MTISDSLLEQIIEGALMASGQTLSVDRLLALFDEEQEPERKRIEQALERLAEQCAHRGYELIQVASGYRYQVKQKTAKWVSRLWEEKPQRYSRALLETLAIIAYRQPVTRGEIEDIRGVAVSTHITKSLLEREWVQVVGHRDLPGRPAMYATTKMFLDYFSLQSLDQLPTLEEIQEIADANHALELEDKAEEGSYDLSHQSSEESGEDALASAAEDMAAAEALVDQVESNVFRKPEEEPEIEAEGDSVENAEQAHSNDVEKAPDADYSEVERAALEALRDEQAEDAQDNEILQAQQQEDVIAKMLAQQQALLEEKALSSNENSPELADASEVSEPNDADDAGSMEGHDTTQAERVAEAELEEQARALLSLNESTDTPLDDEEPDNTFGLNDVNEKEVTSEDHGAIPSIFSEQNDEEDALIAAMEEEAIALLEAEQEELMAIQEEQSTVNRFDSHAASEDPHQTHDEKTLSDLANKLSRTQTTESVDE